VRHYRPLSVLDDIQKSEYSSVANFSRIFDEILVRYQNLSGWHGEELEFVGRGKHPAIRASRDVMQICIITY
jgi:hypothetical protein